MPELNRYSVQATCNKLSERLTDYIESEYLGKNDALRLACKNDLSKPGVLFQTPYVEANPAYMIIDKGLMNSSYITPANKEFFNIMSEKGMGIFNNPYAHQIEALENYSQGKDVFVATGTGSGKTECFMWPMVDKLFEEAQTSPESWSQRGVRVLMLYPMNALVSDQVGRLRRMIGTPEFRRIFKNKSGSNRIPTFGMYTGRTAYSGTTTPKYDKDYANTLRKDILELNPELQNKLKDMGRYPAKDNLQSFIESLEKQSIYNNKNDSELLTRHEMQKYCPDVLITNYSMLEYMLLRPIEKSIWEETEKWLSCNANNKLLFVIDEAHVYHGSSGGEVSLLIKRVLNRLKIPRNKVQFILTSASIPNNTEKDVRLFANRLSIQENNIDNFVIIPGKRQELKEGSIEVNPNILKDFDIDALEDESKVFDTVKNFGIRTGLDVSICDFNSMESIGLWLFDNLTNLKTTTDILKLCRTGAQNYEQLPKHLFPGIELEIAQHALDSFLAILPLAKNHNQPLFPTKIHLFIRGLPGIYACINPRCNCKNHSMPGIGKIYLDDKTKRCGCGGRIFELMNDRSCGTLFIKGYLEYIEPADDFLWDDYGRAFDDNLREVHFYILKEGEHLSIKDTIDCWIDSKTGKINRDDKYNEDDGYIHLLYRKISSRGRPDLLTFNVCPHCKKNQLHITDFTTKGNDPFFNVVSQQLKIQPPTLFSPEDVKKTPNKGRKVLLFSDSRQNAANLAKDLSDLSLEESMRAAITMTSKNLQTWWSKSNIEPTMDLLYPALLKIIYDNNLKIFYGDSETSVSRALTNNKDSLNENENEIDYTEFTNDVPRDYRASIMNLVCDSYRSLTDLGLCWIEPKQKLFLKKCRGIGLNGSQITELSHLFTNWARQITRDSYSLGYATDEYDIREDLGRYVERFGLDINASNLDILTLYKEYSIDKYGNELTEKIGQLFKSFLTPMSIGAQEGYYLDPKSIILCCNPWKEWFKCPHCNKILPFTLDGKCGSCLKSGAESISNDFEEVKFLRKPVIDVLNGNLENLNIMNAEEHTAQLSHKDQCDKNWSTTEDYELRFQNVYINDTKPVDVLSCTTTMEVGIDIGSLTAVGLRNIPPSRENYQQRAGRAGRRSASISTVISYSDRGRYDNYYFNNPEIMVSGNPRTPWIDSDNYKLVQRHVATSIMADYLLSKDISIDDLLINDFYNTHYEQFKLFFKTKLKEYNNNEETLFLPSYLHKYLDEGNIYGLIIKKLDLMQTMSANNQEIYGKKDILQFALEEGLFPTYSFPRNVIGFNILKNDEHKSGKIKLDEKPDRQLNIALSEYVPGREIVVNKKKYISGAITEFIGKRNCLVSTEKMMKDPNHIKTIYMCDDEKCPWFGLDEKEICPFCGSSVHSKDMIVPWGFSPANGRSKDNSSSSLKTTASFTELPCYSVIPDKSNMEPLGLNIKFETRSEQKMIILNEGPKKSGFTVCCRCGATTPGTCEDFLNSHIESPTYALDRNKCNHYNLKYAYLGYDFYTDMVVYEISLDPNLIDTERENRWLDQAATTLSEALCLTAGRILDVDSNDIQSGYRIIYTSGKTVVELYLFDTLSSGAGYCSKLASDSLNLFCKTREYLKSCNCDGACFNCLKNYWNKKKHEMLDRFSAINLLDWAMKGTLPIAYTEEQQKTFLTPISDIIEESKLSEVNIYPSAWSQYNPRLKKNNINISKLKIEKMLPLAYKEIRKKIN